MHTPNIYAEKMPSFQWTWLLTNHCSIRNNKNIIHDFKSARHLLFILTPILFKQLTSISVTTGFAHSFATTLFNIKNLKTHNEMGTKEERQRKMDEYYKSLPFVEWDKAGSGLQPEPKC